MMQVDASEAGGRQVAGRVQADTRGEGKKRQKKKRKWTCIDKQVARPLPALPVLTEAASNRKQSPYLLQLYSTVPLLVAR